MSIFSTPFGQAFVTLAIAAVSALVATVFKMSGRMSRVEGKLEVVIGMIANMREEHRADRKRQGQGRNLRGYKRNE
jgi:hypothetical protein